jgi:hypothetical protein
MNFIEETRAIIELVEQKTDRRVEILPDRSLKVLARVTMARGSAPVHLLSYNPSARGIDYLIAYQCGYILRLFENPPDGRYDFAANDSGRRAVQNTMAANKKVRKMGLPEPAIRQFATQLYDGLMTQLRSAPIGMRIDKWLWDEYPALRDQQKASVTKQQQDNIQGLSPDIRAIAPETVFKGNAGMNAAYAILCDELLDQELFVIPYRSVGYEDLGAHLLDIWEEVPADATHDRELVDAWAGELGLSQWYRWVPFE